MKRWIIFVLALIGIAGFLSAQDTLEEMADHLTFLGYEVDFDGEVITADRSDAAEIVIEYYDKGVLFWAYWPAEMGIDRSEFIESVNNLNYNASASRYYIDDDGDLVIEMWLPDHYDKKLFADSVSLWEFETYGGLLDHEVLEFLQ